MMKIGQWNELQILRDTKFGLFLGDDAGNDVLLPNKYVPKDAKVGEMISVFVYRDSEQRIVATTLKPKIMVGEFASLKVKQVSEVGAFLDWGLEKDLFVPFREQLLPMVEGRNYLVAMYIDTTTGRLAASSRIHMFVNNENLSVAEGDEVDVIIAAVSDLGWKVIVNKRHEGLVYKNELFKPVRVGDRMTGYVKTVRPDNKLDISLQKLGFKQVADDTENLLNLLKNAGGHIPLGDKSEAEAIQTRLQMSKKTFKIEDQNIYLVDGSTV
jgi:uncharacterized protein